MTRWNKTVAPTISTGFVKVAPLPQQPGARDVDFAYRFMDQFSDFVWSDTTGLVMWLDNSGLTLGNP